MKTIGLVGGTGDLGTALAIHFAKNHERVIIGSREKTKAEAALREVISEKDEQDHLRNHLFAAENKEVVRSSDIIIATVPHTTAVETIKLLAPSFRGDQVLISAVAPVSRVGEEFFPDLGGLSISEQIEQLLPKTIRLATAFQTIPANILYKERAISSDVLVACNEVETFYQVSELVSSIQGLRPLYLGSLKLSKYIEGLTAMILNVSIRNHLKSPTLKFNSF